jgi:hypothetical protein
VFHAAAGKRRGIVILRDDVRPVTLDFLTEGLESIRTNPDQVEAIRQHLTTIHADYVGTFDALVQRASAQEER